MADRFAHERRLFNGGCHRLAGVDEAGRGALAGPVVAAAVILPEAWIREGMPAALKGLNDSKQLSPAQRERYFALLTETPGVLHAVALVEAELVDQLNILKATHLAMRRAVESLQPPPDHVLVDGRPVPVLGPQQTALVKGDSLSYSIAAASIVAKVTRDHLMNELDPQFPQYGFAVHKGYGTAQHLQALAEHGPCPLHRRSFAPLSQGSQPELF
ncbi:ribonuclease HII [Fontisphaera persica]|uniref:ribonuclease HII n=1 Tax=Fontisphaera persica TaxID=2974023 RepID=UPI0024C0CC73|nr:ribonuclease HII [Fontisphaera persica]WCJ60134.1 ribonuclease HII [Fontisphaera persica]